MTKLIDRKVKRVFLIWPTTSAFLQEIELPMDYDSVESVIKLLQKTLEEGDVNE